ncbi:MAG: MoaD/ThiS family protein [Trueperaceae bacterium]|nr:MoaD/ThiS family protein [Trueperaceae bacterium]
MNVTVKLFAQHRAAAGVSELEVGLAAGATARDAVAAVVERFGEIDPRGSMIAVNSRYAKPDQELAESDEVAILPPVSGG